ncbi:DUF1659 domain-containing protein [Psychrobacillus sp.]|uniref:DUF1659 domain-containing protein n=1 Tax=Psychrobacillus sp. TaxID=1871623 RepID=UPI0028BF0B93|nr:DUF1659 domain-containing protein [Psychrobacillus sp.]
MTNLEYKQALLKLAYEGGLTEEGKMKVKTKSYRNIYSNATADSLQEVAETLSSFSSQPYIGAEKIETSTLI